MKQVALLFVIVCLFSCTKEKVPGSIVGNWTLTEIDSYNASKIRLSGTELSVKFNSDGSFDISGKPNYTFLQDFNRYKIISDGRIRFYNTTASDELLASFNVNATLSLFYEVRCPYEEKFIRR